MTSGFFEWGPPYPTLQGASREAEQKFYQFLKEFFEQAPAIEDGGYTQIQQIRPQLQQAIESYNTIFNNSSTMGNVDVDEARVREYRSLVHQVSGALSGYALLNKSTTLASQQSELIPYLHVDAAKIKHSELAFQAKKLVEVLDQMAGNTPTTPQAFRDIFLVVGLSLVLGASASSLLNRSSETPSE